MSPTERPSTQEAQKHYSREIAEALFFITTFRLVYKITVARGSEEG